jgi:hypothetical protein
MKSFRRAAWALAVLGSVLLVRAQGARASVVVTVEHRQDIASGTAFQFSTVPSPVGDDLATHATVALIDGTADENGAPLSALTDGKLPDSDDQPESNFFFAEGSPGGRIRFDLGSAQEVAQINSYSWHTGLRAPQIYKAYVATGTEPGFNASPKGVDPATVGWKLLAAVRATPKEGQEPGGQYGVSVGDDSGAALGTFRYVLLDVSRTDETDDFGETFFSEVDIVAVGKTVKPHGIGEPPHAGPTTGASAYIITLDTTGLPDDMKAWANSKLLPTCKLWYPKLVADLPSPGFAAPRTVTIGFKPDSEMKGTPAYTVGNHVTCNIEWYGKQRNGEAVGATIHELVHVVQQYKFGRKNVPFWLQEGIPDYLRWYTFEPEKHGCRIRDVSQANFDKAYRTSANFLDWATLTYDKDLVRKVNAALREGRYTDDLWKTLTHGKTLPQLNDDWKAALKAGSAESNK